MKAVAIAIVTGSGILGNGIYQVLGVGHCDEFLFEVGCGIAQ
ncbi:hypothetical protein [Nostoc sp. T09]|nr:hypothetical protein [Nostoc sp. T09]